MKPTSLIFVVLILAGGIAAGFWWLDRSTAVPDEAEVAGLDQSTLDAMTADGPDDSVYDVNRAYDIAGSHVPADVNAFYLYHVEVDGEMGQQAEELADLMRSAQRDKDFLAVVGAKPLLTYDVFNAALDVIGTDPLDKVIFIYLGRADHRTALEERIGLKDAELRFSVYPDTSV